MLKWSCDNCGKVEDLPPGRNTEDSPAQTFELMGGLFEVKFSIGRQTTDGERRAAGEEPGVNLENMGSLKGPDDSLGFLFGVNRGGRTLPAMTVADLCAPCREHLTREAGLVMQRIGREVPAE